MHAKPKSPVSRGSKRYAHVVPSDSHNQHTRPHTQVPNIIIDLIAPLLGDAEYRCLHYIVRRTFGHVDAASGGQKVKDRISISQFTDGIKSGKYPVNLGAGLSRPSVIKALKSLEKKQLIEVTWSCSSCLWQASSSGGQVTGTAMRCPRCARTCDREFQLAPLSSKKVIAFLNEHHKEYHQWAFDKEVWHFYPLTEPTKNPPVDDVIDLEEYGVKLWHRDMIDKAIAEVNATRRSPMADRMVLRHFYQPILELQTVSEADPGALKRALETTFYDYRAHLRKRGNKPSHETWHRLTRAIVLNDQGLRENLRKLEQAPADEHERIHRSITDLLSRAAALNEADEQEAAREVLSEALAYSDKILEQFNGSMDLADAHIKQAFKLGRTDYRAAKSLISPHDFMPEWEWPQHLG